MTDPTIADIDHCIETIERTTKKWSGSAGYRRFLETELFCLREVRARLSSAAQPSWACAARKQGTPGGNAPADCDWPGCGCDPAANRVLGAIDEAGFEITPKPLIQNIEAEARRYAEMYQQSSDGRNTFIIFADWVASHSTTSTERT